MSEIDVDTPFNHDYVESDQEQQSVDTNWPIRMLQSPDDEVASVQITAHLSDSNTLLRQRISSCTDVVHSSDVSNKALSDSAINPIYLFQLYLLNVFHTSISVYAAAMVVLTQEYQLQQKIKAYVCGISGDERLTLLQQDPRAHSDALVQLIISRSQHEIRRQLDMQQLTILPGHRVLPAISSTGCSSRELDDDEDDVSSGTDVQVVGGIGDGDFNTNESATERPREEFQEEQKVQVEIDKEAENGENEDNEKQVELNITKEEQTDVTEESDKKFKLIIDAEIETEPRDRVVKHEHIEDASDGTSLRTTKSSPVVQVNSPASVSKAGSVITDTTPRRVTSDNMLTIEQLWSTQQPRSSLTVQVAPERKTKQSGIPRRIYACGKSVAAAARPQRPPIELKSVIKISPAELRKQYDERHRASLARHREKRKEAAAAKKQAPVSATRTDSLEDTSSGLVHSKETELKGQAAKRDYRAQISKNYRKT